MSNDKARAEARAQLDSISDAAEKSIAAGLAARILTGEDANEVLAETRARAAAPGGGSDAKVLSLVQLFTEKK